MIQNRLTARSGGLIWSGAILAILLLVGSFIHDQWRTYRDREAEVEQNLRSAALVLAEHTARTLESAEKALQAVARIHADASDGRYDKAQIHRLLQAVVGSSPIFRGVGWTDQAGIRRAASSSVEPHPIDLGRREHFLIQRDGENRPPGMYIAAPMRALSFDDRILGASLRLETPDGSFAGIAAGMLDPHYFAQVYRSIGLGEGSTVTLFRGDGTILVREPADEGLSALSPASQRFLSEIVAQEANGSFHGLGLADGLERIIGYATVPGSSFVLAVSMRRDVAFQGFRQRLHEGAIRLALTVAAICAGAWLLVRQLRRRDDLALELHESEARARDFAAASADWFWETDDKHRFTWISSAQGAAPILSPERHYGRTIWEVAGGLGNDPAAWEAHREAIEARQPFRDLPHLGRTAQGIRWLRTSGLPVFDPAGRFRGYRGTTRDVTELVRAEERLREAVEAIPGGFLLFDGEDRLAYSSGNNARYLPEMAACDRLGDTFEQILRRSLAAGNLPDAMPDPEGWLAWRLQQHRAGGTTLVRSGGRIVEVIERPLEEGGVMVLRFDVTERERARAALQQAREAADAASRAKSDFLANMSHELRTPLNAIIGFAELMAMDRPGTLTPQQLEYAGIIVKSGHHLLTLVDEVLDLSGIEAGRMLLAPEDVALGPLLGDALHTVEPSAERAEVTLRPMQAAPGLQVRADPQRLRQVLINLLSNAVKYNRPGGTVTVSAAPAENGRIRIAVTDTGPGIAAEDIPQLFRPFQRLGAEFTAVEGTGIGLALCKRLVSAMDGRIGCDSEPGCGSTFWIELPPAMAGSAGLASAPPPPRPRLAAG